MQYRISRLTRDLPDRFKSNEPDARGDYELEVDREFDSVRYDFLTQPFQGINQASLCCLWSLSKYYLTSTLFAPRITCQMPHPATMMCAPWMLHNAHAFSRESHFRLNLPCLIVASLSSTNITTESSQGWEAKRCAPHGCCTTPNAIPREGQERI